MLSYGYKCFYLVMLVLGVTVVWQYLSVRLFDGVPLYRSVGVCEVHDFSSDLLTVSDRMSCVPTHTAPSITVCVYPPSMDVYISSALLHTGHWEPHITRQIVQHMLHHPQAGFLDLGANIGESYTDHKTQ